MPLVMANVCFGGNSGNHKLQPWRRLLTLCGHWSRVVTPTRWIADLSPVLVWQAGPCHTLRAAWRARRGPAFHPWRSDLVVRRDLDVRAGAVIRSILPGAEPEFPRTHAPHPAGTNTEVPGPPRMVGSPQRRFQLLQNVVSLSRRQRAPVLIWCDSELEQRTLPGVLAATQIAHTSSMQRYAVGLTVMENHPLDRHLRFPVSSKQNDMRRL